jgi:hypothetical protein
VRMISSYSRNRVLASSVLSKPKMRLAEMDLLSIQLILGGLRTNVGGFAKHLIMFMSFFYIR